MQALSAAAESIGDVILVVGATGRHGGTGRFVAASLVRSGRRVRALVRQEDERVQFLKELGAEIVVGDLRDRCSLKPALHGVLSAFFTYPVAGGIVDAAANFSSAGREAGLRRIVVMSMAASHPESPSHLGRAQWLAEQVLEWAGFSCLHLRIAAFFIENLMLLHGADIYRDGIIRNSYPGDVPLPWIGAEDAARVAVAAMLWPERFGSAKEVYPSGGNRYSFTEIAATLTRQLGRPVRHETITSESWQEHLRGQRHRDARINEDMARHIAALGAATRRPLAIEDSFEVLTGVKARSLEEGLQATLG
jgi:uncharacterized protein YbjT (DUF2867 family)